MKGCPECGNVVDDAESTCASCGHDFTADAGDPAVTVADAGGLQTGTDAADAAGSSTGSATGGSKPSNNGLAIVSLVLAIIGFGFIAAIVGHIARRQIRDSGGTQGGEGMALAGIIIGWGTVALVVLLVIIGVAAGDPQTSLITL